MCSLVSGPWSYVALPGSVSLGRPLYLTLPGLLLWVPQEIVHLRDPFNSSRPLERMANFYLTKTQIKFLQCNEPSRLWKNSVSRDRRGVGLRAPPFLEEGHLKCIVSP